MSYQRPKGTNDILPGESEKWQFVEETARLVFNDYQYQEIRTPIFEHYEVIARSVGDTTDIVSKEMYDFYDKGERHVTLRPEGTAPIVRAYVENKLFGPEFKKPYKVYYTGPMFRYERPQKGRLRQFHQIGVEAFGSENPSLDVEVMAMAMDFFKQLGISQLRLVINTLGDKETRANYRQALITYLEAHEEELSEDSRRRLHENPLRVLDSKDRKDQPIVADAPSILDYLSDYAKEYFEGVTKTLEYLDISYEIDHRMVRGLDYYNHTIFEIMSDAPGMGAQTTICGGGRYDGLVEELGGPETPGIGFAMGIERILLTLEQEDVMIPNAASLDAYVVGLGDATNLEALKVVQAIRGFGFSADRDFMGRKAKAQFKTADKEGAKLVLTLGEDELAKGVINVKDSATREEKAFPLTDVYEDFAAIYDEMTMPKLD
ncbi:MULTISPECIES: histidine--tRNA ligase [Enterococcus]|uniref:Histidine--tRNA ligase n=1 Tax=Enterococcus malodoratus ATCC 43197 TaxID=1158601 RepID=R2RK10_9ENTE|nr:MULTISPECIES: histidine--tRNA ligase [Enterococcus]BBM19001.1 histidine-tRNA ligase [Enterococcus avium]EOH80951.1 histidyl-tRNA synthetase [Enterococcus malodoratus ATCC 43197]EOT69460.1 histidyl-tRNA synthetase [Enterococcus malodoratus ATCC 43197]OJG65191.1 histidyl-tRNA synthetase [Enterococcus malodoratus]SPX01099.1 histidyl-tRNA synthetase [Enterococcus malodoratus]